MIPLERALACAVVLALATACGPIGPFAGGRLSGEERAWPATWEMASDIEQIQLETRGDDPHSVNVWVVVVDGSGYIATSLLLGAEDPEQREWVRNVGADPRVRIRAEGLLYPARLEIVGDAALRTRLVDAFRTKYPELKTERTTQARFFRIAPRSS